MLTINIAGLSIGIDAPDEKLIDMCAPYRFDRPPRPTDFTIELTSDELAAQAALSPGAPEWEVRSLAVYRKLCTRALEYDCILFHCSAVALDGRGYLFAAPSGTGKSTHARLWRELPEIKATSINDDKPLLRLIDGVWFVCGTPWNGKHGLGCNQLVPIQGICFLEQAECNEISMLDSKCAIPLLLNQMLRPKDIERMDRLLELTADLLNKIPMWRLKCLPEFSSAALSYNSMKGV